MIRVLLVDDETMLLDSLEVILTLNDMQVVGKAHDGAEALSLLKEAECDIALVDLNMKGMGGIELIGHMKKLYPTTRILVLTTFYDDANITEAISGGADGYLLKDSGKDAILGAIKQIMGGISVLDPKVMQRLSALAFKRTPRQPEPAYKRMPQQPEPAYGDFTEREQEIAALLAEGLTNRQIADRLYISEGTVKNYISAIYDKTGIHDRVKLVVALKG
ncbi:MAG: response regulator transcription factor [Lachnospiraceae bacterium]|nr:response regulator transcription factor [Lachnospiraceae bacterium]